MPWNGKIIKQKMQENRITQVELSEKIGVSRQALNDWISGNTPKGVHLIKLCKVLNIKPEALFESTHKKEILIPLHRKKGSAKLNKEMQKESFELAMEYYTVFKNDTAPSFLPVLRAKVNDIQNARNFAAAIRTEFSLSEDQPISIKKTFELLKSFGINVIIRSFPEKIKSYAFYTKINGHRVVFLNEKVKIPDLIFPLLHESVHALQDEQERELESDELFDEQEEKFCDTAAGFIQFPENYVKLVYNSIKDLDPAGQVTALKSFAMNYKHSLYGITKRIKDYYPDFQLEVNRADTNLKKKFSSLGEELFKGGDIDSFLRMLYKLSPLFINKLMNQIENLSSRKIAELTGLNSSIEGKDIKLLLLKLKSEPVEV